MWNSNAPAPKTPEAPQPQQPGMAARISAAAQPNTAYIGKTICIKGEVIASESLHVDGRIEGALRADGNYLNIGAGAVVRANVWARETVIRGEVAGNVTVSERLDIRSGGSLVGDIVAHSVSIEEGAYFKGSIDMRRQERDRSQSKPTQTVAEAVEKAELAAAATA